MATNLEKLLSVYLNEVQGVEDMLLDLLNKSGVAGDLDQIEGVQLDAYGSLVGELRKGANDADYRIRILGRILVNVSEGTIEDVIGVASRYAESLIGTTPTVELDEFPPACYQIHTGFLSFDVGIGRIIGRAVLDATAAGVCAYYFFDTSPTPFKFSVSLGGSTPPPPPNFVDPNTGFGTQPVAGLPPTINGPGGEWSSVIGPISNGNC